MGGRSFASKTDIFVSLAVILLAAAVYMLFSHSTGGSYAEIYNGNTVIKRVSLSADQTFTVDGYDNVVFEVKDGAAAFKQSDCPDKICVRTGYIKNNGQSAVCLPNRLTLRIVSGNDGADTYTG